MRSIFFPLINRGRIRRAAAFLAAGLVLLSCGVTRSLSPTEPEAASPTVPSGEPTASPTAAPTATAPPPAPSPVTLEGCVEVSSLRVRGGPGTEFPMTGGVSNGDCLAVKGRTQDGRWVLVEDVQQTGWVSAQYLSFTGDPGTLAVISFGDDEDQPARAQSGDSPDPTPLPEGSDGSSSNLAGVIDLEGDTTRTYTFEYGCQTYSLEVPLWEEDYAYYSGLDRYLVHAGNSREEQEAQYYRKFLETGEDDALIQALVRGVQDVLGSPGPDQLVLALTSLVQNLEYDCQKLAFYQAGGDEGYGDDLAFETNFPYETLYEAKGVCEDSSLLLGRLLEEAGYGAAVLVYDRFNHMAVGIECPLETATYTHQGTGYCYIETTVPSRIGVKPETFDGEEFNEEPNVIVAQEGKSFQLMFSLAETLASDTTYYGEFIQQLATCREINGYKEVKNQEFRLQEYEAELAALESKLNAKKGRLEREISRYESMSCEGTLPQEKYDQCEDQFQEVQRVRRSYNNLVGKYNQLVEDYQRAYETYSRTFEAFDALLEANRESCSQVSFGEALEE